jgi:IstB-like ATP binding protein
MTDATSIKAALSKLFNLDQLPEPSPSSAPPSPEQCAVCHDRGCGTHKGQIIACPANCEAARAYRQRIFETLCAKSGLPGKYKDFSFTTWQSIDPTFRTGKMLAATSAYLWAASEPFSLAQAAQTAGRADQADALGDDQRSWLVISGAHGLGKTGLAAAALNRAAQLNKSAIFMRAAELFSTVQSRYGSELTSADDTLSSIQSADMLILDECNIPAVTPDKSRIFEEVIRFRHARELPTLLTTNMSAQEFRNVWGDRSADVVMEASHWVTITGQKIRRQARNVESF